MERTTKRTIGGNMQRPICGTCPLCDQDFLDPADTDMAICRFRAPTTMSEEIARAGYGVWPLVDPKLDWCGEHPDFPAYIASLKSEESTP